MPLPQSSFITTAFKLINPFADWVSTWRFQILWFLLLLQVVSFCTQGIWVEDFWEHSAAVNAFIQNPFHPGHPQLALQAPHPFLNPYTFAVAQFARLFHIDAISALSFFGALNFCLFCYGLHAFIASLPLNNTNCLDADIASSTASNNKLTFYALLFILFLWGGKPWPYRGFFNYQIYLMNFIILFFLINKWKEVDFALVFNWIIKLNFYFNVCDSFISTILIRSVLSTIALLHFLPELKVPYAWKLDKLKLKIAFHY